MMHIALQDASMRWAWVFQWSSHFKERWMSTESDEHCGMPLCRRNDDQ